MPTLDEIAAWHKKIQRQKWSASENALVGQIEQRAAQMQPGDTIVIKNRANTPTNFLTFICWTDDLAVMPYMNNNHVEVSKLHLE